MSDVKLLYKRLEFTFSMIYKTTAKYKPVVFTEIIYIISEISPFKCKYLSHWVIRILHSYFSFYRGMPFTANKNFMHSKIATGHMQTFHTYIILKSICSEFGHSIFNG